MTLGPELSVLAQVTTIDLVLAGDNAIIVGAIAASLGPALRQRVMLFGIALALVLRVAFSLAVSALIAIPALKVLGGLLLLVVAAKMARELMRGSGEAEAARAAPDSFWMAVGAIALADISMSLDNVLGVAAAAHGHRIALAAGLVLSVALMGAAATVIARVIERHRWIAWIGVGLIVLVAWRMVAEGAATL